MKQLGNVIGKAIAGLDQRVGELSDLLEKIGDGINEDNIKSLCKDLKAIIKSLDHAIDIGIFAANAAAAIPGPHQGVAFTIRASLPAAKVALVVAFQALDKVSGEKLENGIHAALGLIAINISIIKWGLSKIISSFSTAVTETSAAEVNIVITPYVDAHISEFVGVHTTPAVDVGPAARVRTRVTTPVKTDVLSIGT